ncbi:polycomb protein EED [Microdochium nivale]|nr:polycomb protein EED [Microdochium nivale]
MAPSAEAAAQGDDWDLPRLKASIGFEDDFQYLQLDDQDTEFFDVKFYPYGDPAHDPIFAAVSKKHIVIYRLCNTSQPPYELVQLIRDDDEDALNCTCTWTKDPETEIPFLCVAGRDAKIKVYDVIHGKLVRVLVGHGGEINDLSTCPTNFLLIASASDDTTVRIWSLDPADEDQPCVCLLAGEGHSSGLLTVAFHNNGRYVLSAGHDNIVCMWTLPDLPKASREKQPPVPVLVHYPHFFTSEVHSGIVDCVAFFGDLVMSRACHEDIIVLWQIDGFSSDDPPPTPLEAPTTSDTERLTRSAFVPTTASQYTRLIQFHTPGCGFQFYMRFKIFHDDKKHPVLAFGSAHSEIFFWDLARLITYHDFMDDYNDPDRDRTRRLVRPPWLQSVKSKARPGTDLLNRVKEGSDKDSVVSGRTGSMDVDTAAPAAGAKSAVPTGTAAAAEVPMLPETLEAWASKYDTTHVEDAIKAHSTSKITVRDFVGRQVAWSTAGDWCVVVGSKNLAIILRRWEKKESTNNSNYNKAEEQKA